MKIIKRLQKIVGKILSFYGSIDPTMIMALNSSVEVHTKPSIENIKTDNSLLNYSATHPDAV